MKRMTLFGSLIGVLVVVALLVAALPVAVLAVETPMLCWGVATLDGAPAPEGTVVDIYIGDDVMQSATAMVDTHGGVDPPGTYGAVVVSGDSSRYGEPLTYTVNGFVATKQGPDEGVFGLENQVVNLEAVSGPTPTEVTIDIKPGSFPNSLNVNSKGVLPVAILGTEDFDATTVDPETVRLKYDANDGFDANGGGVAPLRWAYEDVNEDGFLDLTLKFKTQELVAMNLASLDPGDTAVLRLTGNIMEEYDGTPIEGYDTVRIINKLMDQPD